MTDPHLPQHFVRATPSGDAVERDICDKCGYVHYRNPKVVAGSVVHHEGKIMLCRRAINPRKGYWTLPAGYMELEETVAQAAIREAREEACTEIIIEHTLAVYSIPRLSQVQIMHIARLATPEFSAGEESLEVELFEWQEIPWDDLAFPSVHWALNQYREVAGKSSFAVFSNPPGENGDT